MQSFKQDSLSCLIHSSPWFKAVDRSSVPLQSVVKNLREYMTWKSPYPDGYGLVAGTGSYGKLEGIEGSPEVDALVFYMLNHAVSVISKANHPFASLGKLYPVVELYREQLAVRSTRMFFYLLLICTRESRHEKNSTGGSFLNALGNKYGQNIQAFHASIKDSGSTGAAEKLQSSPPSCMLGNYVRFLQELFHKGTYTSGYGGPAWGKVTDCLVAYVTGKFSAEMMMDTAFTLCHNNGPIFNKGMLFGSYSHEIYKILDVQRSGQIPAMIANKETSFHSNPLVKSLTGIVEKVLPEIFEGYVDWFKVEALGALKSYSGQKAEQVMKYGNPSGVSSPAVKEPKHNIQTLSEIFDEEEGVVDSYSNHLAKFLQIMPDVKVEIVGVR